jgi:hypothetical protein
MKMKNLQYVDFRIQMPIQNCKNVLYFQKRSKSLHFNVHIRFRFTRVLRLLVYTGTEKIIPLLPLPRPCTVLHKYSAW